jgi:hypothetical protein
MKDIHQILDAYFAGTSTREQEMDLRRYFAGSEIEPELEKYRAIFNCFDELSETGQSNNSRPPIFNFQFSIFNWKHLAAACIILAIIIIPSLRQSWRQTALCEGSFVIVDGKRYDSPEQISKYAISIIDEIVATENQILQDIDFMPSECSEVFMEHARILERFKQ